MRKAIVFLLLVSISLVSPTFLLAQSKTEVLIRNATVLTAVNGTLADTDILIENGKIARIGKNLKASSNAQIIDATGKFVTPGIIDCHSHTMVDGSVNEFSYSVTSMVRIRDVLNPSDIAIYRALAGGVTSANILHGSANSIGGQNSTVKFKYGHPVEDFPIPDAPPGIKFALGENPKRSHFPPQPGQPFRYPRTRMGVMETIRDAFLRAKDYKQTWDDFRAKKTKIEPRRDLELEPLVEVLEGKRLVHAHSYRSDEMLNLLLLADELGFKITTLQHGLEAYKIAPEVARHGTGVSIFVDSWGYKLEAFDAIPYNAYLLWKNGINVSINSDDDARMRRLNLDAAKVEKYGGVPEQDALQMITLNPAKQLGIDKRTGSIEVGKDADIVIWSAHPFSVYSRVEMTLIEGEVFFDRVKDELSRTALQKERETLEKLDVNKPPTSGATSPQIPRERRQSDRDEAEDGGNQ
ncbi:MAG TPA: amidohydrolase [Pyrinomonadaceae bacterium]|jgi:imidazolonepropionase-like amidohydrolase